MSPRRSNVHSEFHLILSQMNLFRSRFDKQHRSTPSPFLFGLDGSRKGGGDDPRASASGTQETEHESVVRWQQDQATLNLTNQRIRRWDHAHDLGRQLVDLLEDANVRVLRVDLSCINCISSETLTQLARAHCRASQLGKQLVLENVTGPVQDVLRVTRLDRLFGVVSRERGAGETIGNAFT